ncbi:twin-arginine translocation signal domain-containing protein [Granulicella sp. L60]
MSLYQKTCALIVATQSKESCRDMNRRTFLQSSAALTAVSIGLPAISIRS